MTSNYISCADTAKIVRGELKTAFPGIKFSVRSKSYSGGASITVEWFDGPTADEVEAITNKFDGASFDGMIDLQTLHDTEWNGETVYFGAHYIHTDRNLTPEFLTKVTAWYCKRFGYEMPEIEVSTYDGSAHIGHDRYIADQDAWLSTLLYREHRKISASDVNDIEGKFAREETEKEAAYQAYLAEKEAQTEQETAFDDMPEMPYQPMTDTEFADAEKQAMKWLTQAAQEQPTRFCDRCSRETDEYRVQDGEVLCERCIRELEQNASPKRQEASQEPEEDRATYLETFLLPILKEQQAGFERLGDESAAYLISQAIAKYSRELDTLKPYTIVTVLEELPHNERRVRVLGSGDSTPFQARIGGELAFYLKRYDARLVSSEEFDTELTKRGA